MNRSHVSLITALLTAALPLFATAQLAGPAAPASGASNVIGPRLPTAAEQKRDAADATSAPDLRPDRAVVPQINIPLGRKRVAAGSTASSGSSSASDSALPCESQPAGLERAACRKRLAQAR